jgi:hypothetical protein
MKSMLLTLAATLAATSSAAQAANARHPYANIDHRIDAGNDTGDAQVEALNEGQLRGASRDWTGSGRWLRSIRATHNYRCLTHGPSHNRRNGGPHGHRPMRCHLTTLGGTNLRRQAIDVYFHQACGTCRTVMTFTVQDG